VVSKVYAASSKGLSQERFECTSFSRTTRNVEACSLQTKRIQEKVVFIIDDDVCTRCALCVDRCPTGVIILGKVGVAPATGETHMRTNNHGYSYGMRF
jgi:NAD-dependent dihydropyrimidine dehydrogenase PreA subunit